MRRLAALAVCAAPLAVAQAPLGREVPLGSIALAPTAAAWVQDATAVHVNPAGLAFLDGPELVYLHERDLRSDNDAVADAVFLAHNTFGFGVGLGYETIRPASGIAWRRTTIAVGYGDRAAALGLAFNLFGSGDPSDPGRAVDRLTSFDLGLTLRPIRFLSLGAVVHDLDAPTLEGVPLSRRYEFSLGLRPLTERASLAVGFAFDEAQGPADAWLRYVASVDLFRGVALAAGFGHPVRPTGDWFAQLGLTLSFGNASLGYAAAGRPEDGGRLDHLAGFRVTRSRAPAVPFPRRAYAVVDPSAELSRRPTGPFALLSSDEGDPFLALLALIDRVRTDPEVDGVLLRVSDLEDLGLARIDELRGALAAVRDAGKKVVAMLLAGGDAEYFLATAADRILAPPQCTLLVNGLMAEARFYADALSKAGVAVDVVRVGPHKSAPDAFTRAQMSPEHRENLTAVLDSAAARYEGEIARTRGLAPEKVKAALGRGILTATEAVAAGLLDALVYPDQLDDALKDVAGGRVSLVGGYADRRPRDRRWGARPRIAVIRVEGAIAPGRSRVDPLGLVRIAGASTLVRSIERAAEDGDVAAVVVRVESGGGSGDASDLIHRAIEQARKKKPVVASMGDVAASGGYYVAMAADEVFANATTITGSIGVFALKPNLRSLLDLVGIHSEVVRRGERADLFSPWRPWTTEEKAVMQAYVDGFYQTFADKVAAARKLDPAKVEASARGRVFTGSDAQSRSLVDSLGGFSEAVAAAKRRAGFAADAEVDFVVSGDDDSLFDLGRLGRTWDLPRLVARALPRTAAAVLELPDGPVLLLPYDVRLR